MRAAALLAVTSAAIVSASPMMNINSRSAASAVPGTSFSYVLCSWADSLLSGLNHINIAETRNGPKPVEYVQLLNFCLVYTANNL